MFRMLMKSQKKIKKKQGMTAASSSPQPWAPAGAEASVGRFAVRETSYSP